MKKGDSGKRYILEKGHSGKVAFGKIDIEEYGHSEKKILGKRHSGKGTFWERGVSKKGIMSQTVYIVTFFVLRRTLLQATVHNTDYPRRKRFNQNKVRYEYSPIPVHRSRSSR